MTDYYKQKLSGQRLRRVYDIASPRIRKYLESEIAHVQSRLRPGDVVLELGCGYGRVAFRLAEVAQMVIGIDIADDSLDLAKSLAGQSSRCEFLNMNALHLQFPDNTFDAVVCIQNGICAFHVNQPALILEALRVTRPGGVVVFSTYSDRFWPHRLAWFEAQAAEGLLGPVDYSATRNGTIVCKDGFRAGRLSVGDLIRLCEEVGVDPLIIEVDSSSVFCEVTKPAEE